MSRVIVAELCPSICWTTFTSAPEAIARQAHGVPELIGVQVGYLALHRRHGLDDDGAAAAQVEPGDTERSHLAEPDAGVGEEQHHQPVGLVGPGAEAAVFAWIGWVPGGGGGVVDLVVVR